MEAKVQQWMEKNEAESGKEAKLNEILKKLDNKQDDFIPPRPASSQSVDEIEELRQLLELQKKESAAKVKEWMEKNEREAEKVAWVDKMRKKLVVVDSQTTEVKKVQI